jgi:hypothetical protein
LLILLARANEDYDERQGQQTDGNFTRNSGEGFKKRWSIGALNDNPHWVKNAHFRLAAS